MAEVEEGDKEGDERVGQTRKVMTELDDPGRKVTTDREAEKNSTPSVNLVLKSSDGQKNVH